MYAVGVDLLKAFFLSYDIPSPLPSRINRSYQPRELFILMLIINIHILALFMVLWGYYIIVGTGILRKREATSNYQSNIS